MRIVQIVVVVIIVAKGGKRGVRLVTMGFLGKRRSNDWHSNNGKDNNQESGCQVLCGQTADEGSGAGNGMERKEWGKGSFHVL